MIMRQTPTPVIFVPGIMGTRLMDRNGSTVWDPTSTAAAAWQIVRQGRIIADPSIRLFPHNVAEPPARDAQDRFTNVSHLVWSAYGGLIRQLVDPAFWRQCPGGIRVYACGYDWRQSNAMSAQVSLAPLVRRALEETGADKVILMAHSMGGLVSRYYCSQGGESLVKGLMLFGSPTHGGPEAFDLLRSYPSVGGADALEDLDVVTRSRRRDEVLLDALQFDDDAAVTDGAVKNALLGRISKRLPSVYELLPTSLWCRNITNWLRYDQSSTNVNIQDPSAIYLDRQIGLHAGPLGRRFLAGRATFDRLAGAYLHPDTITVFGTGLETPTVYEVGRWSETQTGSRSDNDGDGAVPTVSGRADFITGAQVRKVNVGPLIHNTICSQPRSLREVRRAVVAWCHGRSEQPESNGQRERIFA